MVYYSQYREENKEFHSYAEVRSERNGFEQECVSYEIEKLEYFFFIYRQKDENKNILVFLEIPHDLYILCNQNLVCQCLEIIDDAHSFSQKLIGEKLIIDDSKHICRNTIIPLNSNI